MVIFISDIAYYEIRRVKLYPQDECVILYGHDGKKLAVPFVGSTFAQDAWADASAYSTEEWEARKKKVAKLKKINLPVAIGVGGILVALLFTHERAFAIVDSMAIIVAFVYFFFMREYYLCCNCCYCLYGLPLCDEIQKAILVFDYIYGSCFGILF